MSRLGDYFRGKRSSDEEKDKEGKKGTVSNEEKIKEKEKKEKDKR